MVLKDWLYSLNLLLILNPPFVEGGLCVRTILPMTSHHGHTWKKRSARTSHMCLACKNLVWGLRRSAFQCEGM